MDLSFVNSKVDSLGDAILEWARPPAWPKSPLDKYPLADFRSAFYVAVGYLIFVFIASVCSIVLSFVWGFIVDNPVAYVTKL